MRAARSMPRPPGPCARCLPARWRPATPWPGPANEPRHGRRAAPAGGQAGEPVERAVDPSRGLGDVLWLRGGGISLRLEDFELDIVDYLEDAALGSDLPAVAAYFRGQQAVGWPPSPLLALLQQASEGELPAPVCDWVLPRVEKTLTSFKALHGGGTGT